VSFSRPIIQMHIFQPQHRN